MIASIPSRSPVARSCSPSSVTDAPSCAMPPAPRRRCPSRNRPSGPARSSRRRRGPIVDARVIEIARLEIAVLDDVVALGVARVRRTVATTPIRSGSRGSRSTAMSNWKHAALARAREAESSGGRTARVDPACRRELQRQAARCSPSELLFTISTAIDLTAPPVSRHDRRRAASR